MPAEQESFTKTELRAGALVLLAVVVSGIFITATVTLRPAAEKKSFVVYFEDTVGLNRGAEVRFGGVKVGKVTSVRPAEENQSLIQVEVRVTEDTPVNFESYAFISSVTLTAQKHLAISTGAQGSPLLEEGDEIPIGGGDLFSTLASAAGGLEELLTNANRLIGTSDEEGNPLAANEFGTLGSLLSDLSTVSTDLQVLMGVSDVAGYEPAPGEEVTTVASIFDGGGVLIEDLGGVLSDNRETFKEILDNLVGIEDSSQELIASLQDLLDTNRPNIDTTFENLSHISDTVSETADKLAEELDGLAASLESTLNNVEQFSGEARTLLEENGPTLEVILLDTQDMMRDLKEFARTLAEQPQAVLRGKSPTGRQ